MTGDFQSPGRDLPPEYWVEGAGRVLQSGQVDSARGVAVVYASGPDTCPWLLELDVGEVALQLGRGIDSPGARSTRRRR